MSPSQGTGGGDACSIRPAGPRCSFPLHAPTSGQNRGSRATSENNQLKQSFRMMRYWKVRIYLFQTHNTMPYWSLPLPNVFGSIDLQSIIQGRKIGSVPIIIWCFILLHFWVCSITNDVAMFFLSLLFPITAQSHESPFSFIFHCWTPHLISLSGQLQISPRP